MTPKEALGIVLNLATDNVLDELDEEFKDEAARQREAIQIVTDTIYAGMA